MRPVSPSSVLSLSFARPDFLFFSGGTALRETARELSLRTSNVVHVITPFDSGGSSAVLRDLFAMPAVGDIRSRVMALADFTRFGVREICTLLSYRLPAEMGNFFLRKEFSTLLSGTHPLLRQIEPLARRTICSHLNVLSGKLPETFPYANSSIGNLLLTAFYLQAGRKLLPAIEQFSALAQSKGRVYPVVDQAAHLAARLDTGTVLLGQDLLSGKEKTPIQAPVRALWLSRSRERDSPFRPAALALVTDTIRRAACICFPIGSFFSSVLANLLPQGVGRAIVAAVGTKLFIPNPAEDPELFGQTLRSQVEFLVGQVRRDEPDCHVSDVINCVLIDSQNGRYAGGVARQWFADQGIELLDYPLAAEHNSPRFDARKLSACLLRLGRIS